jgi:phosphotransferase system enzyme I (PtsI)
MLEGMAPGPVTVRTFYLYEDQIDRERTGQPPDAGWVDEEAPPRRQGLRGLRLSLSRQEIFRVQLRALLRAARHGHLRIMFPFVSGVSQVREARRLVSDVAADLERKAPLPHVPIGVMIEIPAAAFTADLLAREVDFFTIGTNDLIQYCLAVDRADDRVSRLYEPVHPAILRVLRTVRRAASRQGIPVSVCGEMASDPVLLALLTGLGLKEFSMTSSALARAKHVLGEIRVEDMRRLAQRVMRLSTVAEIEQEMQVAFGRLSLTRE